MEMPDISGITIAPDLLIKCVNLWRMSGFNGAPPDPHDVAMMSTAQNEVIMMTNFIDFVRDEPKRLAKEGGGFTLGDITHG